MAKSVEDRIVAAAIHGFIQAIGNSAGSNFSDRAWEITEDAIVQTRRYLAGETIGEYTNDEESVASTVEMMLTEFSNEQQEVA